MALTPEEQADRMLKLLQQQAEYQQKVSGSFDDFVKGVRDFNKLQEEINRNKKIELEYEQEINQLSGAEEIAARAKLDILKKTNKELEDRAVSLNKALKSVNKTKLSLAKIGAETVKTFSKLPGMIKSTYGELKGTGIFEMDKAMKKSALSMGILSKQTGQFRTTIKSASEQTSMIGIGIAEMSEIQSTYSDELGRTVMLSKEGLIAMGQMSVATGLGAEGAAKLAAEMENQGVSAEKTAEYMEDTMNMAHKMGVNSSKVVKLIQNNMKMLNKYNFKDGVKGLSKMASLVAKLGVDMEFAAGFADKLWDVEGAVDMSAQLQVMGGAWAKLADPFTLMYKARNDMEGLTEDLANAAAASAKFNQKTGEFELAAQEMHRLKIIADQTGMSYDELVKAGKNMAKFSKIKGQVNFNMSDEEKEFLSNTAKLENGKAYIEIDGSKKFLNQMTQADRSLIKAQIKEKADMAKRAEEAMTFDESLTNLTNQLKIYLLPLIDSMNKNLIPKLKSLSEKFSAKGGWGEKIEGFMDKLGTFVSTVGGWMIDNPLATALTYLGLKTAPMLIKGFELLNESRKWYKNGENLAAGFNANVGGGTGNGTTNTGTSSGGKGGKWKSAGKGALAGLAVGGLDMASKTLSGEDIGGGEGIGSMLGSVIGGAAGTLLDPFLGPFGTMLGAMAGEKLGGWIGSMFDEPSNDAFFGSPVHDGLFSASGLMGSAIGGALAGPLGMLGGGLLGGEFSKGRAVVQGGKIHPIDNKDDLLAMKPGGAIDKATKNQSNNSSNVMHVDFETLKVEGSITLNIPGQPGQTVDILKNEGVQREIARLVASQMEKNRNLGKNKA